MIYLGASKILISESWLDGYVKCLGLKREDLKSIHCQQRFRSREDVDVPILVKEEKSEGASRVPESQSQDREFSLSLSSPGVRLLD